MAKKRLISRRDFLHMSAVSAASAVLAACGGAPSTPAAQPTTAPEAPAAPTEAPAAPTVAPTARPDPTTPPVATAIPVAATKYQEAPSLAEMVAAGDLPSVDERLPTNPYTPPHKWLTTGNYGGTMNFTNSWGGAADHAQVVRESQYGHSPLRWLDDGLAIGPGLVESWEANADTSEWTFKFREGLKWSDGEPWTVDDIMYWWEYMVGGNGKESEFPEGLKPIEAPPDEGRSGAGSLATFVKVDDYTLQMKFDAPAPLTADRLAMWVNAGIGPRWMAPRHYMEQFNPVLNNGDYQDWDTHTSQINWNQNPDCPTMTGWMCESFEEGVRATYMRNPYYWVVDADGNQLPYVDRIVSTAFQNSEVEKLNVLQGKSDFSHHWVLALTDVANLRQQQQAGDYEIRFWDSGSGSGLAFFFNYDMKDAKMRELARMPKFRQALSHGFNRAEVQKNRFFGSGELTTGTFSPKAIEYNIDTSGNSSPQNEQYKEWRDSYVAYDPEKAMALLDELGVKAGADGLRTFPDGSPLEILLVMNATAGKEDVAQNEQLVRDWAQIGIKGTISPVPAQGRDDRKGAGEEMSDAGWGIGDGPNHLVFPQWLVPLERTRWASLHGKAYEVRGTAAENEEKDVDPWERKPPRINPDDEAFSPTIGQLWELYDKSKVEPDALARHKLVWDMMKIHVTEGPFVQGSIANFERVFIIKNGLMNVPKKEDLALGGFTDPWIHPTPAVYDPETWFWDDPSAHS